MGNFFSKTLLLTLAFSTIMAWSEQILAEAQAYGLTIQGEFIDVIDMHLHTGTWDALTEPYKERYSERVPKFLRCTMKDLLGSGLTSEGILKQMDKAKIRRAGVLQSTALIPQALHQTSFCSNKSMATQTVCWVLQV